MRKMFGLALTALTCVMMMTGCSASRGANPVVEWQESRIFADRIQAKAQMGLPLTLRDVQYRSVNHIPELASSVNLFADSAAVLYLKVVNGVDRLSAQNEGRRIYLGVRNDIERGIPPAELFAMMPPEDLQAYNAYSQSIAIEDQEQVMQTVIGPLLADLSRDGFRVALLVLALKESKAFRQLAIVAMVITSIDIFRDSRMLAWQISDIKEGAGLWMDLLEQDKAAKEYMQNIRFE